MSTSERDYRKGEKRYSRSGTKSSNLLKPILTFGTLVGLAVVVFLYHKPIFKQLVELKNVIIQPKNTAASNALAYDDVVEAKPAGSTQPEEELTPEEYTPAAIEAKSPVEEEPVKPEIQKSQPTVVASNPIGSTEKKPKGSTAAKAEEAEMPTPVKHEAERFVEQETGKCGLRDAKSKKVLAQPHFDEIKPFEYFQKPVLYAVARQGEQWGVIDIYGKVLVPFEYTTIYKWKDGFPHYFQLYKRDYSDLAVKQNKHHLYGIVKMPEGKITVPVEYEGLDAVTINHKASPLLIAEKNGKKGLVTLQNELKLPFDYYNIEHTQESGYLELTKTATDIRDAKMGIIRTSDCKIIIPTEYEELEVIGPISFIRAKKDGLTGCINDKNEVIVPFKKVNGTSMAQGSSSNSNNRVYFTYPDGSKAAFNAKGERVLYN